MEEQKAALKMLTVIVPRGKGEAVAQLLSKEGAKASLQLYGHGTAPQYWSDMLGLGDKKSDVVLSIVRAQDTTAVLDAVGRQFHLNEVGRGVAFTIGLNGLSSKNFFRFCTETGGTL